jgi:hypothetical protein
MPARRLARDIAVVLTVKVALLAAIFWLFFGPDRRPDVTPEAVHRLLSPTPDQPPSRS